METLEELTQAIMSDEQNKAFTEQGIKPLFTIPKTARINIVGQAPGIRAQESGLYWNVLAVIISGIGWGFHAKNFMNLACLLLCQWIFISQVMVNQVIYLLAKDLQTSGMRKFLL